jgi:hypothetical protein
MGDVDEERAHLVQYGQMKGSRLSYRICSEPRGPSYQALIHYCAAEGELCTLADLFPKSRAGKQARTEFLERAEPHLKAIEAAERWPLGEPETGDPATPTPLWKFRLADPIVDLLLDCPRGLYGWRSPKLPEDLAVYRKDGSVLLGTVAHEHIGWMNLSSQEASDVRLGLVELQPKTR